MSVMTNITNQVWKTLDNSPCIRRCISKGLINTTALAKYIIKEKKSYGTLDAVNSAIRRYKFDRYDEIFDTANEIVSFGELSTKSKLANIAVIKDAEIQELLPKIFSIIQYNRGDVLRIIQADEAIKILVNEKNLEKVKNLFPKKKIIKIDRNLAEINMHLHPEAVKTPGIIAVISNELAMNSINVMETMSCVPEMLWFVKEKDVLKAHNVMFQLCGPEEK
jgi:predicted regulator of amino acid metabolism with ACT domain